jgi:hypothetical protein
MSQTAKDLPIRSTYQEAIPPPTRKEATPPPPPTPSEDTLIVHKDPTVRTGDTEFGKLVGWLSEWQEYLKWEGLAEAIDAVWVWDFFPLSIVQDALIAIVRWVYDVNCQRAYDRGADYGNNMNAQILGWINDLRTAANNELQKLENLSKTFQDFLSNHEKRLKDLEKKMGFPISMPELVGKLP